MTTILVVEDEAVVATDIAQRFKRGGYDVPAVVATGEVALRMTEKLHPDLILMDILLKGEKDGIETAREIEDQFEIPVVFLTGQTDESTLERVRSTSAYGFIPKPIDVASLFPTVELALARHSFSMQLKESESRFRAVTDSAADAIFSMDIQGNVIYWNRAAEGIFGWKADDIIGQSVTAILPESAKPGFLKMLQSLSTRGTYVPPSFKLWRKKDGTEFPAEPSFASWKTKEGTFATAIVRDISEQTTIIESVQAGIALVDPITHKIVDVNTAAARLFGAPKNAIVGSVCHRFICPAQVGSCPITDLEQTVDNAERVLLTADGKSRPVLKSVSRITLSGRDCLLESFIDISDRKQMEQQLDDTLADVQRSNAELEQFAYIASHDLQEPLRMITSYMQIIEEDYKGKLDADADQYIAFTVDGAKRMQTLIDDLLAYSRVGTRGEPFMPTSMNGVLSEAIANLGVAIEESHAVVTHDQLPTVLGDESQLIQLFQNLLGNAIKFRSDAAPIIHVSAEETKDGWVFSVRDNGIGFDMKYAERIFTVFQRLHAREDYPGTGIGLAVVKKIVERHGGRVWVKSAPAQGSTFYLALPKREVSVF